MTQKKDYLAGQSLKSLRAMARIEGIRGYSKLRKEELVRQLAKSHIHANGANAGIGYLDIGRDGKGLLHHMNGQGKEIGNIYVSPSQIKRFALRPGDLIVGEARPPKNNEKYRSLVKVSLVNGVEPKANVTRPNFEQLNPIFPDRQYVLETRPYILAPRIIDLLCPIGRGQRGLVISAPRAGKTTTLKQMANGFTDNYPYLQVMILLLGERPEEITDYRRSVKAEIWATTFEEPAINHVRLAERLLHRAQRQVELHKDVVLLVDSINTLARAYNILSVRGGRPLDGQLNPRGLALTMDYFAAARNLEDSGSLTMVATCETQNGNQLDEIIAQEFLDTANAELHLDQALAEKRIFPAINIERSFTRRAEMMIDKEIMQKVWILRRMLDTIRLKKQDVEPMLVLREKLRHTKSNADFLDSIGHNHR